MADMVEIWNNVPIINLYLFFLDCKNGTVKLDEKERFGHHKIVN